MKNIQIIDSADNCVYDIFSATNEQFDLIFPEETDIAFINEVYENRSAEILDSIFSEIWKRPIPKKDAMGIHGIIFYENDHKKQYYPNRKDEDARNPDGTHLHQVIGQSS